MVKFRNIVLILVIVLGWSGQLNAAEAVSPKPITGTFIYLPFPLNTMERADSYFGDMKANGINTVVMLAMGAIEGVDAVGKPIKWDYFADGTMKSFLSSAKKHNMDVYLGLTQFNTSKIDWDNPAQKQMVLDFNKDLVGRVRRMSESEGWGWENNFIKGWYIGHEGPAISFHVGLMSYIYKDLSLHAKGMEPNKLIVTSPYMKDSYDGEGKHDAEFERRSMEQSFKAAIQDYKIDIIAPQDSIGAGKVTDYKRNKEHFMFAREAFNKAVGITRMGEKSGSYPNAELWANIETFYCGTSKCPSTPNPLPPSQINRIRWQNQAVEEYVSKKISWIHQDAMSIDPLQNKNPMDMNYALTFGQRSELRKDYQRPLIYTAFKWDTNLIIKGYNLGAIGDEVYVYWHYQNGSGEPRTTKIKTMVKKTSDAGKSYYEIAVGLAEDIDIKKPFDIAVQNLNNEVGYFRSPQNDFLVDPVFTEITPVTVACVTPASPAVLSCGRQSCVRTSNPVDFTFRWSNVSSESKYALRINDMSDGWDLSKLSANDTIIETPADMSIYTREIVPGRKYNFWVHAVQVKSSGSCWSPAASCDVEVPVCEDKVAGDADGDSVVGLSDFGIWKKEYLGVVKTKTADFSSNGVVGLEDFMVWKRAYLGI